MAAHSAELTLGRTFGVTFDHGDEFFTSLSSFCAEHDVKSGYIPLFLGAFTHAKVVGTCHHANAEAPMFDSYVDVDYVETVGAGTIAWNPEQSVIAPHVHLSVGRRLQGATGLTSHLFTATVQFVLELVVVEVVSPLWTRPVQPDLHALNVLRFGTTPEEEPGADSFVQQ